MGMCKQSPLVLKKIAGWKRILIVTQTCNIDADELVKRNLLIVAVCSYKIINVPSQTFNPFQINRIPYSRSNGSSEIRWLHNKSTLSPL